MAQVELTDNDVDQIIRLVATEADHRLIWSHPEEYQAQVHGIVDTVLNRVASGQWGDTVASVANARNQFSAINGPRNNNYTVWGSVDQVPDSVIPDFLPNIVTSWVTARAAGTPSSIGGNLNYANPIGSDASNLAWINALDGPRLGFGNSTHYHGTVPGLTPVEASVSYGPRAPADILQRLHDRVEEARGYGQIPPTPAIRQDVLTELRDRAQGVAAAGLTPRLITTESGEPIGRADPPLGPNMLPEETGIYAAGLGSLLTDPMSPATPNPQRQLLADRLGVRPLDANAPLRTAPTMEQLQAIRDVSGLGPSYRDGTLVDPATTDQVLGSIPVPLRRPTAAVFAPQVAEDLRAPPSSLSGPAAGRPGGATEVPMDGSRIDNGPRTVAPVTRQQETVRLPNGKELVRGQSYIVGNRLMIADADASGRGVLRDVTDVRDQWLRENVDPNAPLLLENSLAGTAARMIAAPMIRDQIGQAGQSAQDALGNLFSNAVSTVGGAAMQARDLIGGVFSRPAAPVSANANLSSARAEQSSQRQPTTQAPISANSNLNQARSEQSSQRTSVIAPRFVQLSAPTAGLSAAERNAIAAYTPPAPRTTTVTTTVANPAYAEWERRYGDGSQVQTAATGGNVTRNQLAAIQSVNGAVQAPIRPVVPPPPPRTITTRRVVPVQVTAPMVPTSPSLLRTKSAPAPAGPQTKIDQLRAQGMTSAEAYAALTGGPGSVAAMEAWHGSGESSGGPSGGYAMGGR